MVMTTRPPQLETPFHIFNEDIFTPNDAFFVRWHLANIPREIDVNTFRLTIRGRVNQSLSLSLHDLHTQFEQVEIAAVCQCGGNSRGFSNPGCPADNGAMEQWETPIGKESDSVISCIGQAYQGMRCR